MPPEHETNESFALSANQVSEKINKSRELHKKSVPRWQILYEQKEEQIKKHEMRQKEKEENEQTEIEACSFKPLLTSEHKLLPSTSVEQRTRDWNKVRSDRLSAMASMKRHREMRECTFSPLISKARPLPSHHSRNCNPCSLKKDAKSYYGKREGMDEAGFKNAMKSIHYELLAMSITNPNFD